MLDMAIFTLGKLVEAIQADDRDRVETAWIMGRVPGSPSVALATAVAASSAAVAVNTVMMRFFDWFRHPGGIDPLDSGYW